MWWEFLRLLDMTPDQLIDEDDPIGRLEPIGPVEDEKKGKQTWRYSFPVQEYDLGRGEVHDPANKQGTPERLPVQLGGRRGRSGRCRGPDRRVQAHRERAPPRAIVPLNWVRTERSPGFARRSR